MDIAYLKKLRVVLSTPTINRTLGIALNDRHPMLGLSMGRVLVRYGTP